MKGVILCAGRGTRLRPLTYSVAKHLLPLANKPVLFYSLEHFVAADVRDIGIVVSAESRGSIEAAVANGDTFGARVTYIDQPQPLGLAHAVACARGFLGGEPFLMHLGDTPILEGFRGLTEVFATAQPSAVIGVGAVSTPSRYGIADVIDGHVVRLVEKPPESRSNLALAGAYVLTHEIFECIDQLEPSARGEYEITDAVQALVERGRLVCAYELNGWWQDTGTLDDILEANRYLLDAQTPGIHGELDTESTLSGSIVIGAGARVIASEVRGPVVIGSGARIERARIGPYAAIGDDVVVTESIVEDSVVMSGCQIIGVTSGVTHSLLGRNVRVAGALGTRPLHLLLADDSVINAR